jgi:hypothetical protein
MSKKEIELKTWVKLPNGDIVLEDTYVVGRNMREYDGYSVATEEEVVLAHGTEAVSLGAVVVSKVDSDKTQVKSAK